MRIEAWSWYANRAGPVEVGEAQLKRQRLDIVRLRSSVVVDHMEVGRRHRPLVCLGREKEEVVAAALGHRGVNDSPHWRVLDVAPLLTEEPGVHPLVDHNIGQLWHAWDLAFLLHLRKRRKHWLDLSRHTCVCLALTDAVAQHNDPLRRRAVVVLLVCLDSLLDRGSEDWSDLRPLRVDLWE
jgi:hypothetical protein